MVSVPYAHIDNKIDKVTKEEKHFLKIMSVLLETTLGDIVIDLFVDDCPVACLNFLKLCKIKYYNFCAFYNVQKDFIVQTGDPLCTGKGGESIFGYVITIELDDEDIY